MKQDPIFSLKKDFKIASLQLHQLVINSLDSEGQSTE